MTARLYIGRNVITLKGIVVFEINYMNHLNQQMINSVLLFVGMNRYSSSDSFFPSFQGTGLILQSFVYR
jgi:hypothetical protein